MDRKRLVCAFNEWMRQYTESPGDFEAEFETVGQFLRECDDGREHGDATLAARRTSPSR